MEKKQPKQTRRYSDSEFSTIKATFADNDELLTSIRKFMLQMPLGLVDQVLIDSIKDKPEITSLLRKCILPTLDPDAPRHQMVDLWMTVELKDKSPREATPYLVAREMLINYLDQRLNELEGKKLEDASEAIIFADMKFDIEESDEFNYSTLIARNTIISHIETQLATLLMLAGEKEETVAQTQERLNRNSAK